MDNNDRPSYAEESSLTQEDKTHSKVTLINETRSGEDAGPSGADRLPGAVPRTNLKTGLSKSEHNIRHIITCKDVAQALKLTSMSFAKPQQKITNLELENLRLPNLDKDNDVNEHSLSDVRKFMISCFNKLARESNEPATVQSVHAVISTVNTADVLENLPNTSCNVQNVQTELVTVGVNPSNEVIVTGLIAPVENKTTSVDSDATKKKHSTTMSDRSEFGLANRDSLSSIGSNVCRICMTKGRERLISPCNCKGSLANVHLTCLERWLNQVGRNHCELCGYSYPAIRTPRYTVLQALRLWFGNPRNRSHLQSDCLIFWLLSTVTAGLLAVCIVGTQYFVIEGNKFGKHDGRKEEGISHRITETAMDFFMVIVLSGYFVTVYLLWKDHYVMWNRWRRANVNSDCLIFWLLSTVTAGLLALCIVGRQYFLIEGNKFGKHDGRKGEDISHRITETAMDFFMLIVLSGYFVTVYLLWKDHYVMWNRWRRANVNVRLLLKPDSNPVPFVPRPCSYHVV